MTRTIRCPKCQVELTIPAEAGSRRLRCPQCAERFYPDGSQAPPAAANRGPASSIMAQSVENPHAAKRVKVPPSSGLYPAARSGGLPTRPDPSRDTLDIPLLGDDPAPGSRHSAPVLADAAALFADEPVAPRKKPAAEARRQARRCPSCSAIVPAGMSLCERCGLDLDTGQRIELVPEEEEPVYEAAPNGPPALVLVIGLIVLVAALFLAMLTMLRLDALGRWLLMPACLFAAFGAVQFLRGKNRRFLVASLLLGGAINILVLIVLPAILSEHAVRPLAPVVEGAEVAPPPATEDESDPAPPRGVVPPSERLDTTSLTLGIVILLVDAALLIGIATPPVRDHFEKKRRSREEGFVGL